MRMFSFLIVGLLLPLGAAQAQSEGAAMEPESAAAAEQTSADTPSMPPESTEAPAGESEAPEAGDAMEEQSGFSRGSVVRSVFTTGIEDREPVDKVSALGTGHNAIFYFTELRDMSDQTAVHRWEYDGKVMAEVEFQVRGPRWRVWSKKSLVPGWTGQWKVSVLNGAGEVISEDVFEYTPQADEPATAQPGPATEMPSESSEPAQD